MRYREHLITLFIPIYPYIFTNRIYCQILCPKLFSEKQRGTEYDDEEKWHGMDNYPYSDDG